MQHKAGRDRGPVEQIEALPAAAVLELSLDERADHTERVRQSHEGEAGADILRRWALARGRARVALRRASAEARLRGALSA